MSKSSRKSLVSDAMPLFSAMVFLNVLLTTHLVGQVPGTRDNNHPPSRLTHWPEYRFIYFPEHAMSDIPMPGFHFSVPAETFRRLVDTAQESGPYGGGSDRQCVLVSLELSARLEKQQLVSGKGVMRINSDFASETNGDANSPAKSRQPDMFVTLSPFGLAVSSPVWSNGEPAQLGLDGNGETVLVISPGASELAFDWTLRRDADSRNDLVFSLNLPRFLKTELVLDLPANTKPIVPFGLVQQVEASDRRNMSTESDIPPGYRRWHVAVNGGQTLRLTVAPDETSEQYLRSIGVSELHSYDLSLFGMQLTSMFFFEKSEFVMDTLTLELSQPLSVLSIKTGDRVLPWTEMPSDDAGVTRLLVSMAHMETGPGEIQMETFCPVQMGRPWDLPRVHLRSPLLFWTETQNLVHVNRPLLTRRIIAPHQKQVTPSGGMDETESDLFVFQSFTEESPLGIELEQKQPMLNLESGTWFQWGEREITARAILYFSVEEGQVQQLELDVDSNWTVDLIEAADSTRVANSFVEDTETDDGIEPLPHTRWIVPLRQAVVPSQPVRLIVQLRRPLDANEQSASSDSARKHRYPLSDFMPIRVPGSHLGQQLIAFDSGRHYRLVADDRQEIIASSPTQEQILERFTQLPSGTVFSINEPFQDHFLEEESLHPACEVAAVTNLVVQQGTLWETCRFSCIPTDNSQVGRLTVRFSAHQQGNDGTDWTWALEEQESGSSLPIQTTRNVSKDSSSIESDETWELELTPPRSMPFQVTATRMTPFDSRQAIPLPFFPDIPEVDALVRIETHDSALYHVAQNLLQAVSLPNEATANISAWHVVRGVYQYPAGGVAFSPENTLLVLEPVSTSVRFQDGSANIWSLALHTHYHPGEKVVSFAVITLENRLLDRLRIGLPPGVTADAIRHLWIDGEKTLWSFAPGTGEGGDLFVPLPSQRRYLTLTLEYVEQGDALPDFRAVLQPAMPTFDVPIFTQKWYAWHPPQYRGFDASPPRWNRKYQVAGQSSDEQPTADFRQWLMKYDGNLPEFDLFSSRRWLTGSMTTDAKEELALCSIRLLKLLDDPVLWQRLRQQAIANDPQESASRDLSSPNTAESVFSPTWGELFASRILSDTIARDDDTQTNTRSLTVLMDRDSLAQIGIFPSRPVFPVTPVDGNPTRHDKGLALLERNRLAVIFDGNHNMLVTSAQAAATLRLQLIPVHANRFWYYPQGDIAGVVSSKNTTHSTVFVLPSQWQSHAHENQHPFRFFDAFVPPGVDMPGWVVHDVVCDSDFPPSIQLVRHDTLLTCQLFVFFSIVLVSCRIRPVPMIRVIVPSVAVILLIRFLPPCFSCLVPSAFWGVVCVFALGLIRLMHSNHGKTPQSTESDRSTVIAARDLHDDSEPGEVRHVPPSPTTPDTRQDSGEIPGTETGSSSRHAILTLLVVSAIILFITTKPLSAQPSTFPGVVPATPSPNPLPAEITPETPGNIPETIRGIPDDSNDPPPPCQVYIPYDSQGRIGDRFFLPGPLLNDLPLSWSGKEVASSGHWRICKAHYAGTLTQDPIQNEVTLSNFRVVYDVEIDGASAVVRLPAMPIAPDGIQCDNRLIQPVATGETNRKEYAFTISGQGRHRLEVTLMPTIHDKEDLTLRHFDFPIPPVPDSTLELLLPAANFPVEISPSLGQLSHPSDKLRASLGPAKQLSISWPIRSSFPVNMTVSQYFRFHVASDQVKLHIRFRFNIPSGSIRQVQIMIDPRYKRDGEWRASEAIESSEPVTGMENLRRITFQNPVSKSVTVELDCIPKNISGFADFSGIGTLALPRFRADDTHAQINHSWLGVFSTPSVEIELPLSNVETRIFENAWGRVNEPVQYAYDLLRPPENWFLTVKSRPVRKQINQRQWLLFRNQSILACLEEDVTPFHDGAAFPATDISPSYPAISSFSHEMILPEGFRCETAEVKSDSGQRLIKTRLEQNDRKLLLFFKEPVSGKYTVTLTGTVACEFHTEIPFPLFTHDDQEIVQRSVFCFRETSILVEQSLEEQSVQPIEAIPSPMPSVSPAYFISAYRIESLEQFLPSTIVISPNKPEITGVMVSRLERVFPFTHWNMNISWDVTISHGELDQVSLFIPVLLGETMVVASQPIITVVQTTKKDGTLVELRSRVPLSGKQSFEIRFPIGGTFDTVSVPNVRFLHDSELEHYVALPNYVTLPESSGYKPLTWTLANLSLSDYVPPTRPSFQYSDNTESSSRIDVASIYRYYRAGQRDFVANTGYSHDAAFVSCHSVTCFVRLNGICFVVSEFDIQGSDSSHCEIAFPHEYLLIRLQLNDVFPLPQRVDDATLRVELLSDVPVQRLKLFYCSRQAISGRDQTHFSAIHGFSNEPQSRPLSFPLPQVLSLPVHKTLWEVFFEPLPTTDKQIDTFVNVSDGHKRSSTHKKMVALEQPEAGGLRVRMELARLSWSLAFFRLTSAQPQEESKFSGRQAAWSRLWDGTQRKVHRFLPEWNQNRDQWDESFLFSEPVDLSDSEVFNPEPEPLEADADMAFAEACFSRKKTPQTLYDEIVNQYTALTTGSSLPSLPVDQESNVEAQTDMEHDLDWAYFWDEPVKVRYLAGVTPYGMTDLTLVFHPQITTVPRGVYLHYAFWGTVCLAVLVLAVSQRTQQLFRQFSSLFVIALIVFCWLFVKPNLMGWAVLLIMLISAIRIQWNRMRAATTVVMQNVVDQ